MQHPAIALVAFLTLGSALASGPPEYFRQAGSIALKNPIDAQTRVIYEKAGPWTFSLTGENVVELPGAIGTEINGAKLDGQFARLFVGAWTSNGKYAAEIYLNDGSVALQYETFEYFADAAPPDEWKNFKKIPSWERRAYVQGSTVVYAESKGKSAPPLPASAGEPQARVKRWLGKHSSTS